MKREPEAEVRIEGFFLSFDKREMERVNEALDFYGYSSGSAGVKEFILDALVREKLAETDTERVIKKAQRYVSENPEKIRMAMGLISGIVKGIKVRR